MSAPRLSESEKREIIEAYGRGDRVQSIATQFGVHPSYPGLLVRRRQLALMRRALARARDRERGA